ncbi:DUF6891 domain-containing protein [Corynebacterium freiburgense]|uniref:DUF6891 domain-containing protein n=1 Tax=Corynebacterium freiburgense TaxID=556548 RepID=UPI000404A8B4|nr:hypothetical protein [Corynebacterium freiburgense]WJZ01833.1 hypothetical protein CFREI_02645 [Corynebacterium freiburgense]
MNYNAQPTGLAIPAQYLPEGVGKEQQQELLDILWTKILAGGEPYFEEFVDYISEFPFFSEDAERRELPPISTHDAEAITEYLFNARLAQQQTFNDAPENAITRAFAELSQHNILAKENFTCCNSTGHDEILSEVPQYGNWKAYIFFHQQDTESMFEYGDGGLSYGPIGDTTEAELLEIIASTVIPILNNHGITTQWDGTSTSRINLHNVNLYYPLQWT